MNHLNIHTTGCTHSFVIADIPTAIESVITAANLHLNKKKYIYNLRKRYIFSQSLLTDISDPKI